MMESAGTLRAGMINAGKATSVFCAVKGSFNHINNPVFPILHKRYVKDYLEHYMRTWSLHLKTLTRDAQREKVHRHGTRLLLIETPHCCTGSEATMENGTCNMKPQRSSSELECFDDIFPHLIESLTKNGMQNAEISDAIRWFKEVCEYNVPFGKKNRGISVVTSYKLLVQAPKEEDVRTARILGWCVEWLQAFFLVADDIMDHSVTRRGKPCWYRKDNVGLIAINDSFYLESAVYQILRTFIRNKPYYTHVLELFHETTLQTVIGQCLDLTTAPPEGKVDFSGFTMQRYKAIVKWKTAFYSFYLPVALAMYMAGIEDEESHTNAKAILLSMGEFFQIQDDYLDCFGEPEMIGKIGTDIQDNKCSWLVVQALSLASEEQKQVLQENYGRNEPDCISRVKSLYGELNLAKLYEDFEDQSYADLCALIDKTSGKLPKTVFHAFAQKIYKRQK